MKTKDIFNILARIRKAIEAEGIARLDLTAAEFEAIRNRPELATYGRHVIASPENVISGKNGLSKAESARIAFTAPGFTPTGGQVETTFFHYTAAEIIHILCALRGRVASGIWAASDNQHRGGEATKAKGTARREEIRKSFAELRQKFPQSPASSIRKMLAGKQAIGNHPGGAPIFLPRRKGRSLSNVYENTSDLK